MRTRAILRLIMVALAVGITAIVYWQWTGDTRQTNTQTSLQTEEGPEVLSRAEGLDYTHTVNGIPRYRVRADTNLGYAGGRQEWIDNVRLELFPAPEEEGVVPEPTVITGNKLVVRLNDAGQLRDAEIEGTVKVVLPKGGEMMSSQLVYEEESGLVTTSRGVELHLAGLITRARRMRYDTEASHLRVERDLEIAADPGDSAGNDERTLEGSAGALTYEVGGEGLVLEDRPHIQLTGAAIEGDQILLVVEEESNRVHSVEASGSGRAVWGEGESGPDNRLEAEILMLDLGESMEPQLMIALRVGSVRPRLDTTAAGSLGSDEVEFRLLESDRGEVRAVGDARWRSTSEEATGVGGVRGSTLDLLLGPQGLESARAEGSVLVYLLGREGGEGTTLQGEQVDLSWDGERLTSGRWPAGVSYSSEEAALEAAEGEYDRRSEEWVMGGTPRPQLSGDQYDVSADEIRMGQLGGLRANGDVQAVLRGDRVATIGPVFGGATTLNVAAESMRVSDSGVLQFSGGARLWQGDQHLQAESLVFSGNPALLEARGDVLAILTPPRDRAAPGAEGSVEVVPAITLTGGVLLLEGSPPELRVAQNAELVDGERTITGSPIVVLFDTDGSWQAVEVGGQVTMLDPAGVATGTSMTFDPETEELTILGTVDEPAVFTNDQGVDIRDAKGLTFRWNDQDLSITALQQGQTQTVRGGASG